MHTFQHRYHRNQEGKVTFDFAACIKKWNAEVRRQWLSKQARRSSLRLKTERLLRAFRDKLASKVQASVFKYCAAPS